MEDFDLNTLTQYEKDFVKIYGLNDLFRIFEYMKGHDILDFYRKSRDDPTQLLDFGFHYGIIQIVAFCVCHLEVEFDILQTISGDYKIINSDIPEVVDEDNQGRQMTRAGVPIIHTPSAPDGMIITAWDKFSPARNECLKYLVRMKTFSKRVPKTNEKTKRIQHFYKINPRHVKGYKLLDVY